MKSVAFTNSRLQTRLAKTGYGWGADLIDANHGFLYAFRSRHRASSLCRHANFRGGRASGASHYSGEYTAAADPDAADAE